MSAGSMTFIFAPTTQNIITSGYETKTLPINISLCLTKTLAQVGVQVWPCSALFCFLHCELYVVKFQVLLQRGAGWCRGCLSWVLAPLLAKRCILGLLHLEQREKEFWAKVKCGFLEERQFSKSRASVQCQGSWELGLGGRRAVGSWSSGIQVL